MDVCIYIHLSIYLSVRLSVCRSIYLSIFLSFYLSLYLPINLSYIHTRPDAGKADEQEGVAVVAKIHGAPPVLARACVRVHACVDTCMITSRLACFKFQHVCVVLMIHSYMLCGKLQLRHPHTTLPRPSILQHVYVMLMTHTGSVVNYN